MHKRLTLLCLSILFCTVLAGCQCEHQWTEATCTTPKTCSLCDETEGEALGHDWTPATCESSETCSRCDETEGKALGHDWIPATCEAPETCSRCDETEGNATGHDWLDATCTKPKTCQVCKNIDGEALGHSKGDWFVSQEATVYQVGVREQKCTTCGEVIRSEEFYPDPVFYSKDFGLTTAEFIATFNKLTDGDYEIKPDGDDYVVHWLGTLDIATSLSFTENEAGLLTSISLDGRLMSEHGNQQVKICWALFRVLNPHLSESDSMDEFKYAANSGGKEFIRGARYLYTEMSSLDVLWFTIQID